MAGCYYAFVTVTWIDQIKYTILLPFFEEIYILSFPIIDEVLRSVVVLTVWPANTYAEHESITQQKALKFNSLVRVELK